MPERIQYGPGKDQWGDLYLPEGTARGVVVAIHGGFWRERHTAEDTVDESEDLAARGFAVLNLEYRRVSDSEGAGDGGWPATGEDIVAGTRALQDTAVSGLPIVLLGHSAGGQLAAWAAGHAEVAGVVSQAGPLALTESARLGIGDGATVNFLGATPEENPAVYEQADPLENIPLSVPLIALHPGQDRAVLFVKGVRRGCAGGRSRRPADPGRGRSSRHHPARLGGLPGQRRRDSGDPRPPGPVTLG